MTYEESIEKVKQDRRFEKFKNMQGPELSYEGKVLEVMERIATALEPRSARPTETLMYDGEPSKELEAGVPSTTDHIVEDVLEFHDKMEIAHSRRGLYRAKVHHLEEELNEIKRAGNNREEILDGCIDLIYVALGVLYSKKMLHLFYPAWKRVHAANMLKAPSQSASKFVIKPVGWKAPDLKDLIK